ncbi:PT repeat protein [Frankia sp. AiPs1]|uniref:hypothetical protein n=1 Tax=Frankia sp. AiPa1 TaxID=573492 RepID=UPI00202B9A06|nr:hypothetical protein [Frankia sp. AiPa1]MCL9758289.1 hypothetical protein [Frankia sp. AiPa1]
MRNTRTDTGAEGKSAQPARPARPDRLRRPLRPAGIRAGSVVAGVALAGLAALTSGCGSSGSDGGSPATPGASVGLPTALPTSLPSLPTGLPTSLPSSVGASIPGVGRIDAATGANALRGTNVPADFPVPPSAKVRVGTTTGKTSTVTLTGVSSDQVTSFYRGALPAAGYTITSDAGIGGVARTIGFTGHGVRGSISSAGYGGTGGVAILFAKS